MKGIREKINHRFKVSWNTLCRMAVTHVTKWKTFSRKTKIGIICIIAVSAVLLCVSVISFLWHNVPYFYWWPDGIVIPHSTVYSQYNYTNYMFTDGTPAKGEYYNKDYDSDYYEMPIDEYYRLYEQFYEINHTIPDVVTRVKIGKTRCLDAEITNESTGGKGMIGYTVVEMRIEEIYMDPGTCSFKVGDTILCTTGDRNHGKAIDYLCSGGQYILFISGDGQFGDYDPKLFGEVTRYFSSHGLGVNHGSPLYNDSILVQRIRVDDEPKEILDAFYFTLYAPYETLWREKINDDFSRR